MQDKQAWSGTADDQKQQLTMQNAKFIFLNKIPYSYLYK
jgi:hypothetical protein